MHEDVIEGKTKTCVRKLTAEEQCGLIRNGLPDTHQVVESSNCLKKLLKN